VATVLVQEGTLHVGDTMVSGTHFGKIRALIDDKGHNVDEAGPSMPVEVLGLSGVPDAGEAFNVTKNLDAAKKIADHRTKEAREAQIAAQGKVNLENLFGAIQSGDVKDLNLVVKADVHGSVEAVSGALEKIESDEVKVKVIHGSVGAITESDVMLATASQAIIIGFNVRPDNRARELAEKEHIELRTYSVIYEAVDEVKQAMAGLLAPRFKEVYLGRAEVRETFNITKVGTIAGCYVNDGKIQRSAQIRLLRDGVVVHDGKLSSLKRFKDDAREVAQGYECGMGIEGYNDLKVGDVIEAYVMEQVEAKL
jgi:translation initiation factor IF-2